MKIRLAVSFLFFLSSFPTTASMPVGGEGVLLTEDPFMGHYRGRLNCLSKNAEQRISSSVWWFNRWDAMYYR